MAPAGAVISAQPADEHNGDEARRGAADRIVELEDQARLDSAMIVYQQDELARAEQEMAQLRASLVSSRRIGAAVGIVMAALKISDDDAFQILTRISQRENRKLREVAEDIVVTGAF